MIQTKEKKLSKERIAQLQKLCKETDVKFDSFTLLNSAFTHRSYINEHPRIKHGHNERLEFLGDAVLELIITEYLYQNYPQHPEGNLTSFRAAVVCTSSLANLASKLSFGKYLMMSKGEETTGGRTKEYLLANTFEAFLGALYREQGYDESKKFIVQTVVPQIDKIVRLRLDIGNKTKLQELIQTLYKVTPHYRALKTEGPAHNRQFTMGVFVKSKLYGTGIGHSKQEGEEAAALQALKTIKQDKQNRVA